jgi:O-succinylbenzoic acid--CoA ligase
MRGYLNQEPLPRDAEGISWFPTGDIGYLDAEGDLWIVQRRHDIIISGGENIYPAEVEAVLQMHPAVAEAAVMGIISAEWGQQVAAAIVARDPLVTADDLLAFTREHLAGYKQPRALRFVAELPRTASGKIHRPALQRLLS